jgi:hypothetical protein
LNAASARSIATAAACWSATGINSNSPLTCSTRRWSPGWKRSASSGLTTVTRFPAKGMGVPATRRSSARDMKRFHHAMGGQERYRKFQRTSSPAYPPRALQGRCIREKHPNRTPVYPPPPPTHRPFIHHSHDMPPIHPTDEIHLVDWPSRSKRATQTQPINTHTLRPSNACTSTSFGRQLDCTADLAGVFSLDALMTCIFWRRNIR